MRFSKRIEKASRVGAFFVCVLLSLQAQALCSSGQALRQVAVGRVVDGDTLHLADGRRVRLIGLNAPELAHDGRRAEPFARAAKDRLQALVDRNGGRVGLRPGAQARDHYGRLLAHAFDARGDNLEAAMLADGVGFFVALAPNTALADCHLAVERQARRAGRGVWKQSPVHDAARIRRAGFALVRARVERVETNRGGVWLELQGPLVVQIPAAAAAAFGAALADLPGRTIEARGWIIDRKGRVAARQARWLLKLTHPSMLALAP